MLSSAFTATHTQHPLQQRPSSRISSLLIKAAEHFGVMNCTSGEQSLIYGQEQESRPSVTFPLTLNTLISIHSINFRGPCRPVPMSGTQKQLTQSHCRDMPQYMLLTIAACLEKLHKFHTHVVFFAWTSAYHNLIYGCLKLACCESSS